MRQLEERLAAGAHYEDHGLIFATPTGAPPDGGALQRTHFDKVLRAAGLPKIRVYDLRHTCASLLLVAGTHPKVVSELLGHSTITLTLDTYSHMIPGMLDQTATTLDRMLRPA